MFSLTTYIFTWPQIYDRSKSSTVNLRPPSPFVNRINCSLSDCPCMFSGFVWYVRSRSFLKLSSVVFSLLITVNLLFSSVINFLSLMLLNISYVYIKYFYSKKLTFFLSIVKNCNIKFCNNLFCKYFATIFCHAGRKIFLMIHWKYMGFWAVIMALILHITNEFNKE